MGRQSLPDLLDPLDRQEVADQLVDEVGCDLVGAEGEVSALSHGFHDLLLPEKDC